MELFLLFFPLCFKVMKTFVYVALLALYSTTFTTYIRPTVCDIMMMYSKERYMESLPKQPPALTITQVVLQLQHTGSSSQGR